MSQPAVTQETWRIDTPSAPEVRHEKSAAATDEPAQKVEVPEFDDLTIYSTTAFLKDSPQLEEGNYTMLQTQQIHRVTVDFSDEAYIALEQLSNDLRTTKADVLRRALGLMRFVVEETNQGANVILENPKTKDRKQVVRY